MGELPVDLIYDILSRLPVKSLYRFRCTCKTWCNYIDDPNLAILHLKRAPEEPLPIMFESISQIHLPPGPKHPHTVTLSGTIIKSEEGKEMQKKSIFQFECNEPLCNIHVVQGSCNGLFYLQNYGNKSQTTFSVIHPLRKQRYELPPIFSIVYSCGLGFDDSTNTFKMCVWDVDHKAVRIMVHVLGTTDSWREISQVPYYIISGRSVFADGYLHWLGRRNTLDRRKVIRFDVRKEEFSSIDPPRKIKDDDWNGSRLVDLGGEVGFVYSRGGIDSMEVWVLKQNQWVVHTRFDVKPPLYFNLKSYPVMEIVGLWNKSGDILVSADGSSRLFVYSRKSQDFHEIKVDDGWEDGCRASVHMYQSSLFSILGMKKQVFLSP